MFTSKYRYLIIVLLGGYSYVNTVFSEVYKYYGITVPWYDTLLAMIIITGLVWECNRLLLKLFQHFLQQLPKFRFLVLFFLSGMVLAAAIGLAITLVAGKWLQLPADQFPVTMKLSFTYATRINLFLHIINGIFILNREYRNKELEAEALKRINAQAQLQVIKNQVNPHFLFNNLNVLSGMVIKDNPAANIFIEEFSKVYRYILNSQDKELIPLSTELEFIKPYIFLLQKRFPDSINFILPSDKVFDNWFIVPAALQMLIENAIKHNVLSEARPLEIRIWIEPGHRLHVSNNLQPKPALDDSTQLGLNNIRQRYELITGKGITVAKTEASFTVSLPLIQPNQ